MRFGTVGSEKSCRLTLNKHTDNLLWITDVPVPMVITRYHELPRWNTEMAAMHDPLLYKRQQASISDRRKKRIRSPSVISTSVC